MGGGLAGGEGCLHFLATGNPWAKLELVVEIVVFSVKSVILTIFAKFEW